jgi:hypothetical protein
MSVARKIQTSPGGLRHISSGTHRVPKDPANEAKGRLLQSLRKGLEALEGSYWSAEAIMVRGAIPEYRHVEAGMRNFTRGILGKLQDAFGCDLRSYLDGREDFEDAIVHCIRDKRRL